MVFVGYAVLMTIPWIPSGFAYNIDESYKAALNQAFANNLQFGKDFVYTYGPYGFLQNALYFPQTYAPLVSGRAFLGLIAGAGLFRLFEHCWNRDTRSAFFLLPLVFFFPNSGFAPDSFFLIIATLPLLIYFYVDRGRLSPTLGLLIVGTGLVGLIKQTSLTLGLAFMLLIAVDQVLRRKWFPTVLAIYALSIFVFWLLAGQSLSNFKDYLANASQIVKGFSETMGRPGAPIEMIAYVVSFSSFLALAIATTHQHNNRQQNNNRSAFNWLPILGLALIAFLTFKAAFLRQDSSHTLLAAMTTVPVACLYSALLWPEISRTRLRLKMPRIKVSALLAVWILLTINAQIIFSSYTNVFNENFPRESYFSYYLTATHRVGVAVQNSLRVMSRQADLQAIYNDSLADIRAANPMPQINKTTSADLYPNSTSVLFAYDLPYRPRPVIQSFSAYTADLAKLNASHLRDENAPETILFDIGAEDRLPSADDGLSWPELLTRYDITDTRGSYLVLQRRAAPREYLLEPLSKTVAKLGDWVELPAGELAVWMTLDARANLVGKLMTTFLKLPPLYIEVEYANGLVERYRALTDVMSAGQLISPMVSDRASFAYMAAPNWRETMQSSAVKRFRLTANAWSQLAYPRSYPVEFSALSFERQSMANVMGWSAFEDLASIRGGTFFNADSRRLEPKLGPEGNVVLRAHADTKVVVSLPEKAETARELSIGFGLLDAAWQESEGAIASNHNLSVDGVMFRVSAISTEGEETLLFSQWLDPHENEADRGEKQATVTLPAQTDRIVLKTLKGPNENDNWDWSYWSKFEMSDRTTPSSAAL